MKRQFHRLRLACLLGLLVGGQAMGVPSTGFERIAPRVPSGLLRVAADAVMVQQPWARASAGNATTGAAYVTLVGGSQPDRLTGASTPAATTAQVHESFTDNGVMKMRPVAALAIPPGQTVTLAPGGYHVMLTGLKQKLVAGGSFPLTLTFEHAPPVTVEVQVRPIGQSPMGGAMGQHDGMHMN